MRASLELGSLHNYYHDIIIYSFWVLLINEMSDWIL